MKRLRGDPRRVVILGAGEGGTAMLDMATEEALIEVVAMVDLNDQAIGMMQARRQGIETYTKVEEALQACAPCVAFNLTGNEMIEEVAASILGAGGVIGGLEARLIWRMVTDLQHAKRDLEFQATHDLLTGLYNRRFVTQQLEREISQGIRYGAECAVVLIDLDLFKNINDTYGHVAGDDVLKFVSNILRQSVRSADILGRWGGEEFIVLLPYTDVKSATIAANKWLQCVSESPIELADGTKLQVTFSAGVTALKVDKEASVQWHFDALLNDVDGHLYAAKDAGRACVIGEGINNE